MTWLRRACLALLSSFAIGVGCSTDGRLHLGGSTGFGTELAAAQPFTQPNGRGTLVLDGGGRMTRTVTDLIVRYAGPKPRLCLIDTAMEGEGQPELFFLNYRNLRLQTFDLDQSSAQDPAVASDLSHCTGYFFNGGDPERLSLALVPNGDPSPALAAIRNRFEKHGAVISGSSAGAMIVGPVTLCECGEHSSIVSLTAGQLFQAPGFGLVRDVLIDAHFFARGLLGRHLFALARAGLPVGVGIDESTAVVVPGEGGPWQVVGRSQVAVITAGPGVTMNNLSGFTLSLLSPGDSFDPRTGTVTVGGGRKPFSVQSIQAAKPLAAQGVFRGGRLQTLLQQLAREPATELIGSAMNGIRVLVRETPQTVAYRNGNTLTFTGLSVAIERPQG